jgi:hypothetical protein
MEEEAKLEASRPQIILDLPYCAIVKRAGGLGLDYQLPVDNHVESLPRNLFLFVKNRHGNFATDVMATMVKLVGK